MNLPLLFGALLAGAVVMDYGVKALRGAFAAHPPGSSSASAGLPTSNVSGMPSAGAHGNNPFPGGWTPGRLDLGYDGTFSGHIAAPVTGTITYAATSFSNWGGWVQLKADAPIPGLPTDTFYFAENLAPTVHTGQHVNAGDPIASAVATGGGGSSPTPGLIEWGLSQPGVNGSPTDPLAKVHPNPGQLVNSFAAWAEKAFGLPAPSQTSHAGYA